MSDQLKPGWLNRQLDHLDKPYSQDEISALDVNEKVGSYTRAIATIKQQEEELYILNNESAGLIFHYKSEISELREELKRQEAELAEPRKDRERLDKLIKLATCNAGSESVCIRSFGDGSEYAVVTFDEEWYAATIGRGVTPRLAIDAAEDDRMESE